MWTPQAYATLTVTYHHRARYRVTVEGEQKRTWSMDRRRKVGQCLHTTVGNGTETASFTSTDSQIMDVEKDGSLSPSPIVIPLRLILQRSGHTDLATVGEARLCTESGGGEGVIPSSPEPDCGRKHVVPAYLELQYAEGKVTLATPNFSESVHTWDPYRYCAYLGIGLVGPPEVDIAASVSADKVKQGQAVVAAVHTTIRQQTNEESVVTTLRWIVTFTPIDR
jgi:hypothetical protein